MIVSRQANCSSAVLGCGAVNDGASDQKSGRRESGLTQMSVLVTSKSSDLLTLGLLAMAPVPTVRISRVQLPALGMSHTRVMSTFEVTAEESVGKTSPHACEGPDVP